MRSVLSSEDRRWMPSQCLTWWLAAAGCPCAHHTWNPKAMRRGTARRVYTSATSTSASQLHAKSCRGSGQGAVSWGGVMMGAGLAERSGGGGAGQPGCHYIMTQVVAECSETDANFSACLLIRYGRCLR